MTPLLSGSSRVGKRIRRNNSVKYYGKIPSISLALCLAFDTVSAQIYPDGSQPKEAFYPYPVEYLINPDLPMDSVEVAPAYIDAAQWLKEKPTEKPAGVPANYILVRVFAHVNYDYTQLAFLGWIWLDAESVNRLHEKPVQPRL